MAGESVNRGALGGYINSAQERGLSQRAALRELRGADLGVRDSDFRDVWHQVASSREKAGALADLGGQSYVPDELHTDWNAGVEGRFVYNVNVHVREDDGTTFTKVYSVTSDDPMVVDDALAEAIEGMELGTETETGQGQSIEGATLAGAFRMTGSGR